MANQKPKRIVRKRTKGWRMPANTVAVSRPSRFGNPHKVDPEIVKTHGKAFAHQLAVVKFENTLTLEYRQQVKEELKGKNLCCYCGLDLACHVDVLLRIANEEK